MLLKSNLRLLHAQLEQLAETPYFSARLDTYIAELRQVTSKLIDQLELPTPGINLDLASFLVDQIWRLTQFLTGSTTKQIPYEVVYAIERAAADWTTDQLLITTAIVQEANFYFHSSNEAFFQVVEKELGIVLTSRPVQIALPYIYRHKPLFCIPLFHELGHFVDGANEVVNTSMLISPETSGPDLPDLPPSAAIAAASPQQQAVLRQVVLSHRKEYFADLFSAAYVGNAAIGFMREFCPAAPVSHSHPSTSARFALMQDFLAGSSNPIIDLFQASLAIRGLSKIQPKYSAASLANNYSDVRPYSPGSDAQLFGVFEAGWNFLMTQWSAPVQQWSHLLQDDRVRVANDLTEKSIRNRMLVEGWNAAINAP